MALPDQVVKRDGSRVPFDLGRVRRAIQRCYDSMPEGVPVTPVHQIVDSVAGTVAVKFADATPTVEAIQDIVEYALLNAGEYETARSYILYREEHAKSRVLVPAEVHAAFAADQQYFASPLQQFVFYDKYSRYDHDLGRRETWSESIDRAVGYLQWLCDGRLDSSVFARLWVGMHRMRVMPSMRLLAQAGSAAQRNSMAIYNCAFLPVRDIDAFVEIMLATMAGCGVGYSVERDNVEQFPRIKRQTGRHRGVWVVEDTTEGWGDAVRAGLHAWFEGEDIDFNFDYVRKAGTPLLIKGGRASGPGPLRSALEFMRSRILSRQGTFLRTLDAHDMACASGGAAVSGGVRQTAMIAIFDYDDLDMASCKDGSKLDANRQRWNANNSAVWPEQIEQIQLVDQFAEMYRNQRGEPGIFSRANGIRTMPDRRRQGLTSQDKAALGVNPCGEIWLKPYQFCNLSIAVARHDDRIQDLREKVELATIIGTIQSLATHFPGMRPDWKRNCEQERLLGVDINGQQDCPAVQDGAVMRELRALAIDTNLEFARQLGINQSAAITCAKPNGNSSQMLDCSSGIHRRWSQYYIRNARVSAAGPMYRVLKAAGVPMDPENGQTPEDATTWVVHFPVKAPEGVKTKDEWSAVEQCEYWLLNKLNWTEHNPSFTCVYQPDELLDITRWVWEHRDVVGGMTFLPADDAQYDQMPYEKIDKETYERLAAEFPVIDYSLLHAFEHSDMTEAAQQVACSAGSCDLV